MKHFALFIIAVFALLAGWMVVTSQRAEAPEQVDQGETVQVLEEVFSDPVEEALDDPTQDIGYENPIGGEDLNPFR